MEQKATEITEQAPDEKLRKELLARYPKLDVYSLTWTDEDGKEAELEMYLRPVEKEQLEFFLARVQEKKSLIDTSRIIIEQLLVYPDKQTVGKIFDRAPGLPGSIGAELQQGTGLDAETQKKRLTR